MELKWSTASLRGLRGLRGLAVFQLQNHRFQLLQLFGLTTTLQSLQTRLGRCLAQHLLLLTLLNRLKQGRNSLARRTWKLNNALEVWAGTQICSSSDPFGGSKAQGPATLSIEPLDFSGIP